MKFKIKVLTFATEIKKYYVYLLLIASFLSKLYFGKYLHLTGQDKKRERQNIIRQQNLTRLGLCIL